MSTGPINENNPSYLNTAWQKISSAGSSLYENIKQIDTALNVLTYGSTQKPTDSATQKTHVERLGEACINFGTTIGADKLGTNIGDWMMKKSSNEQISPTGSPITLLSCITDNVATRTLGRLSRYFDPRMNLSNTGRFIIKNTIGDENYTKIATKMTEISDLAGTFLRNLPQTTFVEKIINYANSKLNTISKTVAEIPISKHIILPLANNTATLSNSLEKTLMQSTAGKITLTVGKVVFGIAKTATVTIPLVIVDLTYQLTKGIEKGLRMIPTVILDTYKVLSTENYTTLTGRAISFLGYGLFAGSYAGTHTGASVAGLLVFHELKASMAARLVFGAVDGAFHGEITGEPTAEYLGWDRAKTNMTHRIVLGTCGAICGAFNCTVGHLSAGEVFEVGLTGKLVILGGMCLTSLITSPLIACGECIMKAGTEQKEAPHNLFYKKDIENTAKACASWISQKLNQLRKPLTDISQIWNQPSQQPVSSNE